jgi:hypothetical protein
MNTPNDTGKKLRLMEEIIERLTHPPGPVNGGASNMRMTRSARRAEDARLKQQQQIEKQARLQSDNAFLKLPPEVRNNIYHFVLCLASDNTFIARKYWKLKPHPLSVTCRQIRNEFLPLLRGYQMYELDITGHAGAQGDSKEWLDATRESHEHIRLAQAWLKGSTTFALNYVVMSVSPDTRSFKIAVEGSFTRGKRLKIERFLKERLREGARNHFDGTDIIALAEVLTGKDIELRHNKIFYFTVNSRGESLWEQGPDSWNINHKTFHRMMGMPDDYHLR